VEEAATTSTAAKLPVELTSLKLETMMINVINHDA
jgi:hypothetical protein